MRNPLYEVARTAGALRCDQSKLPAMTANSVDEHGALTDQKLPRTMQDQDCLPLCALDRHETHGRTAYRLADRFGIGSIVLLAP